MPQFKRKRETTRVTIERRNGILLRVTTILHRKERDREEITVPYNALATIRPVPSIWTTQV